MKKIAYNGASACIALMSYWGILTLVDKFSGTLDRTSGMKNIMEQIIFWLSHLGFGIYVFIALTIIVYFSLVRFFPRYKAWKNPEK